MRLVISQIELHFPIQVITQYVKTNREWVSNHLPFSLGWEKGSCSLPLLLWTAPESFDLSLLHHQSFWSILHAQEDKVQAIFSHAEIAADVKIFLALCGSSGYWLRDTCTHISQLCPTTFSSPCCLVLTPKGCIKKLFWCVYLESQAGLFSICLLVCLLFFFF